MYPTAVNDQITDSVTQSNVKVIAESPAISISNQILAGAQSYALMGYNAVAGQNNAQILTLNGLGSLLIQSDATTSQMIGDLTTKVSETQASIVEQLMMMEGMLQTVGNKNRYNNVKPGG